MRVPLLFLLVAGVCGYYSDVDMGFFLIPKNNKENKNYALTLYGSHASFEKLERDKKSQIFILENLGKSSLCLKHSPERCLRLSSDMIQEDVSFFKKKLECKNSVKKSKVFISSSPYKDMSMVRLGGCKRLCLFSHRPSEHLESRNFFLSLGYCRPGNLNNMYKIVSEEMLDELLQDQEVPAAEPALGYSTQPLFGDPLAKALFLNPLVPQKSSQSRGSLLYKYQM